MLPTLRKFVRHVAPKLLSETAAYAAKAGMGMAGARGSRDASKATSKLMPTSPSLVTFGSMPSTNRQRGYAKFGGGPDGYPLETIRSSDDMGSKAAAGPGAAAGAGKGAAPRAFSLERVPHHPGMGVVNTHVVGGQREKEWDVESGGGGGKGKWRGVESQKYPVVTTRIEVTYGTNDDVAVPSQGMTF